MTALADRRRYPRIARVAWLNAVQARIRPGHDVLVIDLSHGGALVETSRRLAPGTVADLHLESTDGRHSTRASVVRSYVCALQPGQVLFRAALLFDRPVPWVDGGARVAGRRTLLHAN